MSSGIEGRPERGRRWIFAGTAGMILAFCYVAGYRLDRYDTLDLMDRLFYLEWIGAAAGGSVLLYLFWQGMDWISRKDWGRGESGRSCEKRAERKPRIGGKLSMAGLLFLCWLPTLCSIFPGAFSYDAFSEWEQVRDWALTSHHPVAHVLLLGGLVEGFWRLTGSYNAGIAVYSVLQMLLMAWVFVAVIDFLEDFGVPRFWRVLSFGFFALSPTVSLFSVCATKDVLFTGAELLFFLYVVRFGVSRGFAEKRRNMVRFALAALFTMIFRNNGVYIVLLTLAALGLFYRRRWNRCRRNLLAFLLVLFVPWLFYVGPVYRLLGVASGGVEEMLSVPLQQMARVYRYEAASLSEKELEALYRYVDRDALEQYRPTVADFVKKGFRRDAFAEDRMGFVKLWGIWGGYVL